MSEQYTVRFVTDSGADAGTGTFTLSDGASLLERTVALDLDGVHWKATESDYFEALCTLHVPLEARGIFPHCYGASRNVYPSGMGRDMGAGLRAYKLKIGVAASIQDLVSIFDTGDDVEPATLHEQRQFFEQWLKANADG